MRLDEILARCDHTLLSQGATREEIRTVLDDGIAFGCASVCIAPSFVRYAKEYVSEKTRICTVIGFPNGYSTTETKVFETERAVADGADEIDMVINIGALKEKRYSDILTEINAVKAACRGRLLKVIIETALLTETEKVKMCEIVSASDADYIKTSTGFAGGGATFADIELMAKHIKGKRIKAAGGISSLEDAEKFISLGADRLGTSRIVKLAKNEKVKNGD